MTSDSEDDDPGTVQLPSSRPPASSSTHQSLPPLSQNATGKKRRSPHAHAGGKRPRTDSNRETDHSSSPAPGNGTTPSPETELTLMARKNAKVWVELGAVMGRVVNTYEAMLPIYQAGLPDDPDADDDQVSSEELEERLRCWHEVRRLKPVLFRELKHAASNDHLQAYIHWIDHGRGEGRANDQKNLKRAIINWLPPAPLTIRATPTNAVPLDAQPTLTATDKATRGYHNDRTARALCPQDWLSRFDSDLEFRERLRTGEEKPTIDDYPSFLFAAECGEVSDDNPFEYFCLGELLMKVWKGIFFGQTIAEHDSLPPRGGPRSIAGKHDVRSVTPASIAYAAVQLRGALTSDSQFNMDPKAFGIDGISNHEFYKDIKSALSAKNLDAITNIIDVWNLKMFPDKYGAHDDPDTVTGTRAKFRRFLDTQGKENRPPGATPTGSGSSSSVS